MAKRDEELDIEADIVPEEEETGRMKGKSEQKLRTELKKAQKEKQEYLEGWQRTKADLVNFKREVEQERSRFAKFAAEDVLHDLLPVLDSFELAVAHTSDQGVQQVHKQLVSILAARGLKALRPEGDVFDPEMHESVGTLETNDKKQDGTVAEVTQTGYTLHDKLIRPARVKVSVFKEG